MAAQELFTPFPGTGAGAYSSSAAVTAGILGRTELRPCELPALEIHETCVLDDERAAECFHRGGTEQVAAIVEHHEQAESENGPDVDSGGRSYRLLLEASNFGYRLIGGRVVAERCFAVNSLD